jgi:hypothetical protein
MYHESCGRCHNGRSGRAVGVSLTELRSLNVKSHSDRMRGIIVLKSTWWEDLESDI